jgi:hypothetical protein
VPIQKDPMDSIAAMMLTGGTLTGLALLGLPVVGIVGGAYLTMVAARTVGFSFVEYSKKIPAGSLP